MFLICQGPAAAKVESYFCLSLQLFTPQQRHYDVIWCQWVLAHLTDEDFVAFLKRCREGLRKSGVIIVKENVTTSGREYDHVDSSVARSSSIFTQLFASAGVSVLREERQRGFPEELYEVKMWALR
jgi:protein N-terminal methyltransferase